VNHPNRRRRADNPRQVVAAVDSLAAAIPLDQELLLLH
jgi:hypothetical protein